MIFKDDAHAIEIIKANKQAPQWMADARDYSRTLRALITGEGFADELINRIEIVESERKAKARKKFARPVKDLFKRLLSPIDNVYSATGSSKTYKIEGDQMAKFLKVISNIRDGKTLKSYLESKWMPIYHRDPSGIIYLEYITNTDGAVKVYPTYKSSGAIRSYLTNGQALEWVMFEPKDIGEGQQLVRIVDDTRERFFVIKGEDVSLNENENYPKSFDHPFGSVPGFVASNLTDDNGNRLSPVDDIIPLVKEFARDQSIKTLYKFSQGFPKHWRRTMFCKTCHGSKKGSRGETCITCGGAGEMGRGDVTDVAILPMPEQGEPVLNGNDIMGYSSPDLETWKTFTTELKGLEDDANRTLWGVEQISQVQKTATGVFMDLQPKISALNKYADVAEFMEWQISEWIANAIIPGKKKEESICSVNYGRRYILEGPDVILNKYESARKSGANSTILDRMLDEYITIKFQTDPEALDAERKKVMVEPFIHLSIDDVHKLFGPREALRKNFFSAWWEGLLPSDRVKDKIALRAKLDSDFVVAYGQVNQIASALAQLSPLVASGILNSLRVDEARAIVGAPTAGEDGSKFLGSLNSVSTTPTA